MANEAKSSDPIGGLRTMAAENVRQARKATNDYLERVKESAASAPLASTDQAKTIMKYAEQNMSAAFDFAEALTQATSLGDLARIQTEFMQKQMQSFGEQSRELVELGTKAAFDLFRLPFKT